LNAIAVLKKYDPGSSQAETIVMSRFMGPIGVVLLVSLSTRAAAESKNKDEIEHAKATQKSAAEKRAQRNAEKGDSVAVEHATRPSRSAAVHTKADTDHDGKISVAETNRARAFLHQKYTAQRKAIEAAQAKAAAQAGQYHRAHQRHR